MQLLWLIKIKYSTMPQSVLQIVAIGFYAFKIIRAVLQVLVCFYDQGLANQQRNQFAGRKLVKFISRS